MDIEHSEVVIDDVQASYNELYLFWQNMDEVELTQEFLNAKIDQFKKTESQVISQGFISPNEEFDELLPENLKFLVMPIIQADFYTRKQGARLEFLNKAEYQYHQFQKLMSHYEMCPSHLEKILEKIRESPKYQTSRDEKIQLFRETKEIDAALEKDKEQYLQEGAGGNPKQYMKSFCISLCYKAIDQLKFLPQEKMMLEYRTKLETDPETKQKYDEEMAKPLPKPQWKKIDSTSKELSVQDQIQRQAALREQNPAEYLQQLQERGFDPKDPWAEFGIQKTPNAILNPNGFDARMDKMGKVFQPDHAQPVMTMETHGDIEYNLMCEKHKQQDRQAKAQEKFMAQFTAEEIHDQETLKERYWDDWKDDNEKGAGNRGDKHGAT